MSQHDYNIANGGGAAVRADINNALLAVLSQNSGATAPTTTKPFMFWYDTTTGVLKMRNAADTAWVDAITGVSGGNGFGMVNRVINGRMEIDQRNAGAAVTPAGVETYTVDRFSYIGTQASKFTFQQNAGSVTPPSGFKNYLGFTVASAVASPAAGDQFAIYHKIEGLNCSDFDFGSASASTVTVSFWVRSSLTGTFSGGLVNSAGNRSYVFNYTINAANTWEQKTVTIAGDTTGTWLTTNGMGIQLRLDLGSGSNQDGTASAWQAADKMRTSTSVRVVSTAGATFYVTGVDLRKGTFTSAPAWDWRPYGTELALCQRYYQQITSWRTDLGMFSGDDWFGTIVFPVCMRAAPTQSSTTVSTNFSGVSVSTSADRAVASASPVGSNGGYYLDLSGFKLSAEL